MTQSFTLYLTAYRAVLRASGAILSLLLALRLQAGKEHAIRMPERKGIPSLPRPVGKLAWIHAASVGEAQSALILLDRMALHYPDARFLVTTGTLTSASLMEKRLPARAMHQFYPLDCPTWTGRFLDHWRPDIALWMESELWPSMISALKERGIPSALINARLSDRSFARWRLLRTFAGGVLSSFSLILAQSADDATRFQKLGHDSVMVTGNLKYSAAPLSADPAALSTLSKQIAARPLWVYASTHKGEEELAAHCHLLLKEKIPGLLTLIVPRHPERGADIAARLLPMGVTTARRGLGEAITPHTDIYIADTLGELGLFYTLSPIAVIGRTFSEDGGGGHNPIEAAQLGCAVLSGPHVQFQRELFSALKRFEAVDILKHPDELAPTLLRLLASPEELTKRQEAARAFARHNAGVVDSVMDALSPLLAVLR